MANNWFKFKQFRINQSESGMKVGTDGVLLGAWAQLPDKGVSALDIGSGTGLLALMLAQKYSGIRITAVEIEKEASIQAVENFKNSDWGNRIILHHISFQDFLIYKKEKYDLIISNPPYFRSSLKNPNEAKSLARHQDTLNLEDLFMGVSKLLNETGFFSLIVPFDQKESCLEIAENIALYPRRILNVRPKPEHKYIRVLMEFSCSNDGFAEEELTIEMNERHNYSEEYRILTKDFYLKF